MNSKRIIISFLIFICIYSCKNQENGLGFNQSISNEFVYITPDMYSESRDSLKIDIPLEFYIKKPVVHYELSEIKVVHLIENQ